MGCAAKRAKWQDQLNEEPLKYPSDNSTLRLLREEFWGGGGRNPS